MREEALPFFPPSSLILPPFLLHLIGILFMNTVMPTFDHEIRLWQAGYQCVAGIDEVGRGALAGPVVAAAVIVPPQAALEGIWAQVCDSKLLTPARRVALENPIQATALAWGIGSASASIVDQIGIAAATRQAMRDAVAALQPAPDYLLIDWVRLAKVNVAQESFAKADLHIVSVAAASILAKVHRDRLLTQLHEQHPIYGFHQHKGYGTRAHLAALERQGPCPEHRYTFAPVARKPSLFG
jgi:ribonuclease HII